MILMPATNLIDNNPFCKLMGVKYPICQAGMYQVAYGELAAAVSEAGGLGVIGSAFMAPEELRAEIKGIDHKSIINENFKIFNDLLLEHKVIFFRNKTITNEEHPKAPGATARFRGDVDPTEGLDVTGAALTTNQEITQSGSGQVLSIIKI